MRPFLLGVFLLLGGCSIFDFDVGHSIREQVIEGSGLPEPVPSAVPLPLELDLGAAIDARDTGPIDGVTLSSLTLTITGTALLPGDVDDWSFLSTVDVHVRSTAANTRLPRRLLARVAQPGAVTTLTFDVEGFDLQPYVDEGSAIEAEATGHAPVDDVSFKGKAVFTVHPL